MAKQVDFKNVVSQVRYGILGSFQMVTPSEFKMLSDKEQFELYNRLFKLHHDVSNFLTSYLDIDDLNQDYNIDD